MEQYKPLIDLALQMAEAAAKLTDNKWDDHIAEAARAIFNRFLREPHIYGSGHVVATASESAAVPTWLMPLVLELVRYLLSLKKS